MMNLKYISLITLSVQNAMFSVSIRYSRIRQGNIFLASTAVLNTEIAKFVFSIFLLYADEGSFRSLGAIINEKIIKQPLDTLKVCIPSLVYVIQNNLQYVAASHLDAATFQITYQLKILSTAIFSVLLLKKNLLQIQWLALVILLIGVILVELADTKEDLTHTSVTNINQNRLLGVGAAFLAACCSGFAGIFFEMILKGKASTSLWVRNVQLSFCSIPIGLLTCLLNDWTLIQKNGFFYGYDGFVVYLITLQTLGGILVGLVVKFADNLLKGFAAAFAIVLACTASIILFNFQITLQFVIGTFLIIISIFLYGYQPSWKTYLQQNFTKRPSTEYIKLEVK